uniref:beta-galactoside alpha-(2,6)-sialyltransferase n=1 Tax=Strigamia maritima TaxID=126957 RepID=T1JFY6_STRMM
MRIVALSIWLFINLTIFGLFAYVYILWSRYWKMTASPKYKFDSTRNIHVKWIQPQLSATWLGSLTNPHGKIKHIWDESMEHKDLPTDKLEAKIETYKNQLIVQLRERQLDSSNILLSKAKNRYNVYFQGYRASTYKKAEVITCAFKKTVKVRFLDFETEPFRSEGLSHYFPTSLDSSERTDYNSCAIVSSSGSLYKSNLGREIDSHDAVLRFNNAPVETFESDVGSKTTHRIINSQVISKPQFNFLSSPLYQNITLMVWDPANYSVDMNANGMKHYIIKKMIKTRDKSHRRETDNQRPISTTAAEKQNAAMEYPGEATRRLGLEWFHHPEFNVFNPYFKKREERPEDQFYIFHPQTLWDIWDFIQTNTGIPLLRNPPSSGFLGIAYFLQRCNWVYVYEYIPSMRLTKRCHYYDVQDDLGCTFGDWHPLASEKLLALAMHVGSDVDVFNGGIAYFLQRCNWVYVYEYIPSMRLTKRCHYYDVQDDLGCTFGDWHPLASEKLLALAMHVGSDVDVFNGGFLKLDGFLNTNCAN